ncbi:putative 50S ribosomal subunit protein L4 [Candidatus Zinderia insecticola CARI]|uniref:Large ribosomal subunit protein uL4 n=1 Tax=Zinderia insecticola (strain CARI) TaxID=871271 RepID=E0TJ45_ZINIC|nr:putative 50S ribosomal subunit protein L4 [Candidatus Zinderia insecticola CARI]
MKLKILNIKKKKKYNIKVLNNIFNYPYNLSLIHQVIISYLSNNRKIISKQKNRSEVKHNKKKLWKQKGTGRARVGNISSPLWRGGGKIFPNTSNENYRKKINKKMYKISISSILSQLNRENRLLILNNFLIDNFKTKNILKKINKITYKKSSLFILDKLNFNILYSFKNLYNIFFIYINKINPISLINFQKIILMENTLYKIQKWLNI